MKCPNCGAEANSNFCEYCGSKLSQESGNTNINITNNYINELPASKQKKKSNLVWWILGWIVIFPVPLTILMIRKKQIATPVRYLSIAAAWIVYLAIGLWGQPDEKDESIQIVSMSTEINEESMQESEYVDEEIIDLPVEEDIIVSTEGINLEKDETIKNEKNVPDEIIVDEIEEKNEESEPESIDKEDNVTSVPEPDTDTSEDTTITRETYNVIDFSGIRYAKAHMNIREIPSFDGAVIGTMEQNQAIDVTGICGEWFRVDFNGEVGYGVKSYLLEDKVDTNPKPAPTPSPREEIDQTPVDDYTANDFTVYTTPSGKRFHLDKECAGKNAIETKYSKVKNDPRLSPCKTCATELIR